MNVDRFAIWWALEEHNRGYSKMHSPDDHLRFLKWLAAAYRKYEAQVLPQGSAGLVAFLAQIPGATVYGDDVFRNGVEAARQCQRDRREGFDRWLIHIARQEGVI